MSMVNKVVYLFGSGATQAEMELEGFTTDKVTMGGINNAVFDLSTKRNGEYSKLIGKLGISPYDQDVEHLMSLFQDGFKNNDVGFIKVYEELKHFFREHLISSITLNNIKPRIASTLMYLHKEYGSSLGENGEKISGILTTNYDGVIDEALNSVYGGVRYGQKFFSSDYSENKQCPYLIKLHGAFNWQIKNSKLYISKKFGRRINVGDHTGWMPPSVYKKPEEHHFKILWQKAKDLLLGCNTLRVVGSSLRNEDWSLISLIFASQVRCKEPFTIELIIPNKEAVSEGGVMERLRFLAKMKNFNSLPIIERDETIGKNVFHYWILKKIHELERKKLDPTGDKFINKSGILGD